MAWLAWAALGGGVLLADGDVPIARVAVRGAGLLGQRLVARVADLPAWGTGGRAILARASEPLGWLEWDEAVEGGGAFVSRAGLDSGVEP
ncbi:MAG: hypothetical protein KKB50_19820, partial [Planctomycetes bacterium]|nr:hypothetical protein [Planctomycetota bacterium]